MYVRTHVYTSIQCIVYTCKYNNIYICIDTFTVIHMHYSHYIYIYSHNHIDTYINTTINYITLHYITLHYITYIHACVCIYIYIYIYIAYMYVNVYIYIVYVSLHPILFWGAPCPQLMACPHHQLTAAKPRILCVRDEGPAPRIQPTPLQCIRQEGSTTSVTNVTRKRSAIHGRKMV